MAQLERISERIGNVRQIESVIVAMRAMAAAHAQEARRHLRAIRQHEETVARALAEAMALVPVGALVPVPHRGPVTHLRIVVGAAQGFSGSYNETIVSGVLDGAGDDETCRYMLVGQRCISEFAERGRAPDWSANMVAHAADVPSLASNLVDALFARLDSGEVHRVSVVYADPAMRGGGLTVRPLMPFEFGRFARARSAIVPETTIEPHRLLARLVEEYVFTEICEALMLGFAAENDARMNAMTRARTNVRQIAQELQRRFHQARQEETTTEIIELSATT
ncbi:MAG: F0F1 ATP synthase subunit gamma [Oricola sp.]